jgi:FMN phosphatase YigB (HAD superfamily)
MVKLKLSSQEQGLLKSIRSCNPRAIIFDMDGTLYDEVYFVKHFADALSARIVAEIGPEKAIDLKKFFLENWCAGSRRRLFEYSIEKFGLQGITKEQMMELMRNLSIPTGLPLKNWAIHAIIDSVVPMAVLTNGDPETQRKKFSMLQPHELLEGVPLFCAKEIAPKPSPLGAKAIIGAWGLEPSDVLFLGDNRVDELCAEAVGCQFIYC